MANISILDTGYLKTDNSGTQLSTGDRFNSGNAMELKGVSFDYQISSNIDDNPSIGTYSITEVNFVSFDNPKIKISGVLAGSSTSDMQNVYKLTTLSQTKGYKIVYYNSTGTDKNEQLVYWLANNHINVGSNYSTEEKTYYHIHVRFTNFKIEQVAPSTGHLKFDIEGVITA